VKGRVGGKANIAPYSIESRRNKLESYMSRTLHMRVIQCAVLPKNSHR